MASFDDFNQCQAQKDEIILDFREKTLLLHHALCQLTTSTSVSAIPVPSVLLNTRVSL